MLSERRRTRRWLVGIGTLALTAGLTAVVAAPPAEAMAPNSHAFVEYNGVGVVPTATLPGSTTVTSPSVGIYTITFPGVGLSGGVAHVTAINPSPHWCQIINFAVSGTSEIVNISCYATGGVLSATPFSAIFDATTALTAPAFGYVYSTIGGGLISQYNSTGGANSVVHTGLGSWNVTLPGLITPGPQSGGLQVTAVSQPGLPAHCQISYWFSTTTGELAQVLCHNATGAALDTPFTLSFQYTRSLWGGLVPPKYFGYAWNQPPLGPAITNFNNITGAGTNTIAPSGVGVYTAAFPALAQFPDDVQVSTFGSTPAFCGLTGPWTASGTTTVVQYVNCFGFGGTPLNNGFLISDNSAV